MKKETTELKKCDRAATEDFMFALAELVMEYEGSLEPAEVARGLLWLGTRMCLENNPVCAGMRMALYFVNLGVEGYEDGQKMDNKAKR